MKLINNVEFPTEYPLNQDCILYEDNNRIMFQLKHIIVGFGDNYLHKKFDDQDWSKP